MAFPLLAIPSMIQGAVGVGKLVSGLAMKNKRPELTTPPALNEAVNMARGEASATTTPLAELAKQNLRLSTAESISKAENVGGDTNSLLNTVSALGSAENAGMERISAMESQDKQRRQGNLQNQLTNLANEQIRQENFNKVGKFEDREALKSSLLGGGAQDINTGLSDIRLLGMLGKLGKKAA